MGEEKLNFNAMTEIDLNSVVGGSSSGFWQGVGYTVGYVNGFFSHMPKTRNKDW